MWTHTRIAGLRSRSFNARTAEGRFPCIQAATTLHTVHVKRIEVVKIKLKDKSYSMSGELIRDDGVELEYEEGNFFLKEDINEELDKFKKKMFGEAKPSPNQAVNNVFRGERLRIMELLEEHFEGFWGDEE